MRIAMLHWGFPPIIGGVETHLSLLCPELVRLGNQVSLLTGSVEGVKNEYVYEGVEINRTPLLDLNWLSSRGLEDLERDVEETIKKFLERVRPDVIHVHNFHYFSKLHALAVERWAKEKGIPLILTAHNTWDDGLFLELTLDIKWDHIIAVSDYIKKQLIGTGIDENKITTIHHGIDTNRFSPSSSDFVFKKFPRLQGRRIIFHPARMGIAKGCDDSVKALRVIRERFPDVILVLAGTNYIIDWVNTQQKEVAYILHLIHKFGLEDYVFIDFFTHEVIHHMYQASEFAIYPSKFDEPFGLATIESMACGKPIIVTNMGGMVEVVKDGFNGFVIPVKDTQALAEKAILLLSKPFLKNELGLNARKTVEERFTKEIMTDKTYQVYKRLIR